MSMILNMNRLASGNHTVEVNAQIRIEDLQEASQHLSAKGPLHVQLEAKGRDEIVHVQGPCSVSAAFVCSRCLSAYEEAISFQFDEGFTRDREIAEANEEDDVHYVGSDAIDLQPYIEQRLMLEIPYVPLCKEDCEGLCIHCGGNRNDTPCDCKDDRIDPRLAGLEDFFKN